jgi:acyl-CoA reductase-like NAD-dependent aldehyde dehydrogenase
MRVINPATEEASEIKETSLSSIPAMAARAREAQKSWGLKPLEERIKTLRSILSQLEKKRHSIAKTISEDTGKPLRDSLAEAEKTAARLGYFLEKAPSWLAPEPAEGGYVEFDPLGVVAVISPWNFPLSIPLSQFSPPSLQAIQ